MNYYLSSLLLDYILVELVQLHAGVHALQIGDPHQTRV